MKAETYWMGGMLQVIVKFCSHINKKQHRPKDGIYESMLVHQYEDRFKGCISDFGHQKKLITFI